MPLALCYEACQLCGQRHSKEGRGWIAFGEVYWSARQTQAQTFPRVPVPYLCARQRLTERARSAQVEATRPPWRLSRSISKSCSDGGPGPKPSHRAHITTISSQVR